MTAVLHYQLARVGDRPGGGGGVRHTDRLSARVLIAVTDVLALAGVVVRSSEEQLRVNYAPMGAEPEPRGSPARWCGHSSVNPSG